MNKRYFKNLFAALVLIFFVSSIILSCQSEKEPSPDVCDGTFRLVDRGVQGATCGQSNGSVSVLAENGVSPVTYTLNGNSQTTGFFENLRAGNYAIDVEDALGCTARLNVTVPNVDGVTATIDTQQSSCGGSNGSITVNASEGQTPYSFSIDGGAAQDGNTFNDLAPGVYTVKVVDNSGCEFESEVRVESDIVFADVNSIVQTNCAISGCHNGSQPPNLTTPANISASADRILARTQQGTMPPANSGKTLTQAEIDAIACWVNDGAKND